MLGLFNQRATYCSVTQKQPVPTFYLYGEPHRFAGDGFVHIEPLDDRSRPSEWTIAPHSHAELCHVFHIATGGGSMRADTQDFHFIAPALLVVPAMTVHGFTWLEESTGTVVSMANRYVQDLARHDEAIRGVFASPFALPLASDDIDGVERCLTVMMQELGWSAPGHRAAVDANALSLLVVALRKGMRSERPVAKPGPHAMLVARLRDRIEQRFRLRESISDYADALGISETALRLACKRVAGASPGQMLDQRAMLEAQRALSYSNLSVAEIGYSIGFTDPAYFSRFFQRHSGIPPSGYRAVRAVGTVAPGPGGHTQDSVRLP